MQGAQYLCKHMSEMRAFLMRPAGQAGQGTISNKGRASSLESRRKTDTSDNSLRLTKANWAPSLLVQLGQLDRDMAARNVAHIEVN
jgi:hypothetical protein